MHNPIEEWVEISEYDLLTAKAMLDSGRYLYVAFMCQQALEKLLKAYYAFVRNELPPRTHNLLYLIDILKLIPETDALSFLAVLNQFYIETRYPGERLALARTLDSKKSKEFMEKTQELWSWLRNQLPSNK